MDNASPLTSVWEKSDGELLKVLLDFYPSPSVGTKPILDATFNKGRIWKGSGHEPVKMDINPDLGCDYCCDNREMPGVPDDHFAVVVYDPPHFGNHRSETSSKALDEVFGVDIECSKETGWTLSYLYPDFLVQARRVLKPEGLLLAKITDQVTNHRSRWAHVDFMEMAAEAGFTVCDLIIKVRKGPMMSSKWKNSHHARKRHSFWIVCRNGPRCER